jgi:hypothetical protein
MTTERDLIISDLQIKQNAQFNMVELYHSVKAWFDINRYSVFEVEHEETVDKGKKSLIIKLRGFKEIDDYIKFQIDLTLKIKNYELIEGDKEKLMDGGLNTGIKGIVTTDYEDRWGKSPVIKFLKGVSDKFYSAKRRDRERKELKNDCYDLHHKIKAFLNLHKFR